MFNFAHLCGGISASPRLIFLGSMFNVFEDSPYQRPRCRDS
jgi:hypothetical protein